MTHFRRSCEWTAQQRQAIDDARRLLQPHFPGENVRLYVPARAHEVRMQADQQARELLAMGYSVRIVAGKTGMSIGKVGALSRLVRRGQLGAFNSTP